MRYESTRGETEQRGFLDVLCEGLASDGGLFVPAHWPTIAPSKQSDFDKMPYADVALQVIAPFVGHDIQKSTLHHLIKIATARFGHPQVAPLVHLKDNIFILELFHGPTLAFKDVALQLLGHLFDHALQQRGRQATIVGATSGDTGSAAIEGCRGRDALDIFILHPHH